ncbi:MAG: copper homeostasis protein CutC [Bacteroidota bacterium]
MITTSYQLEACVQTIEEALIAQEKGAHQLEYCAHLELGGTTPSFEEIQAAREKVDIKIKMMIRPRGGNFVYDGREIEEMEKAIRFCKGLGIEGVVFGVLKEDNTLDLTKIAKLAKLAYPMEVTIHRAIDDTPDILLATEELKKMEGVHAVLSAGQAANAWEGRNMLKEMVATAGQALTVIPGGGVTKENVGQLHQTVGTQVYHGTKIVGPLFNELMS